MTCAACGSVGSGTRVWSTAGAAAVTGSGSIAGASTAAAGAGAGAGPTAGAVTRLADGRRVATRLRFGGALRWRFLTQHPLWWREMQRADPAAGAAAPSARTTIAATSLLDQTAFTPRTSAHGSAAKSRVAPGWTAVVAERRTAMCRADALKSGHRRIIARPAARTRRAD